MKIAKTRKEAEEQIKKAEATEDERLIASLKTMYSHLLLGSDQPPAKFIAGYSALKVRHQGYLLEELKAIRTYLNRVVTTVELEKMNTETVQGELGLVSNMSLELLERCKKRVLAEGEEE